MTSPIQISDISAAMALLKGQWVSKYLFAMPASEWRLGVWE